MREALEWYKDGRNEHERYIAELTDIIEKLERQSRELNRALLDTKRKDNEMIDKQRHLLDLKNDELNFIYLSKQWKIATALKEARHSLIALIKLPFRVIRLFF